MQRLYEWLSERASVLRPYTRRRIVRTETRFEHRSTTLLLDAAAVATLDACPLCGSSLASAQTDRNCPSTCPPSSFSSVNQAIDSIKETETMSKSIFYKTAIACLVLASAVAAYAEEPVYLYGASTTLSANQPFAIATTVPPASNTRSQYVAVAKPSVVFRCMVVCTGQPVVQVQAWNDTATGLVPTSSAGTVSVSNSVSAIAATGLDPGRVVTAEVDSAGVLSIRTWTVGATGAALQNGYSTAADTASPEVSIATLSSTQVVTAYALPKGTLAVEEWTISASGLPVPLSPIAYQNGNNAGPSPNQPMESGFFAHQISLAAVTSNELVTAVGDSNESMWVTSWGVNGGTWAQQLLQIPNTVNTLPGSVAVGAGQTSVLVPGIGLRPPFEETLLSAFTPFINPTNDLNVFYWTVTPSGLLTQQSTPSPTMLGGEYQVAAVMLPTNVAMTGYGGGPGCLFEQVYQGYSTYQAIETICPGDPSPSPNFFVNGPVHSAAEGNNPPSSLESYNAYFVSGNADWSSDILNIEVFSYTLPPTIN